MQLCGNVLDTFRQEMERMIQSGLKGELGNLHCEDCDPTIKPEAMTSLYQIRSNFTEDYEINKTHQYGGAVTIVARFDTGYEMTCYFRGENPIVVESCSGESPD
jgi:hypothetical protein